MPLNHQTGRNVNRSSKRIWFRAGVISAALFLLLSPPAIEAQPLGDLMQQLQQRQNAGIEGVQPAVPQSVIIQPVQQNQRPVLPASRLEQIMSQRAGAPLQQFGYDLLGSGSAVSVPQTGAIQDDYILGAGDEIVVSLRGQENNEVRAVVDRNGQILLPRLAPVPAIGRSFRALREDIEAAVRRTYVATNAFVSVGRVRQITVLVSGEVNIPGQRLVTGLSSVVDALMLSGGVRKTGSLRNVRIQRAGREIVVDLYSVLTARGIARAMRLTDGDRILVPLLGPTVAVSGLVRQPGIFELPARASGISAEALLQLAGGQEVRGLYRTSILRIEADGRSSLVTAPAPDTLLRDSEILFVQLGANQVVNQARLTGGSALAGTYPIAMGTRLSQLLQAPGALGENPYSLFGMIVRRDQQSRLRRLIPFTPVAVLAGREDLDLQGDDIVRIFSVSESRMLDFVMRSYVERLTQADAEIRNPVTVKSEAVGDSAREPREARELSAVQRQSEQELRGAAGQSFIVNVPSEIQRNTIIALLDVPTPGSPLAFVRAEQERRDRQAELLSRSAAVPATAPPGFPPQQALAQTGDQAMAAQVQRGQTSPDLPRAGSVGTEGRELGSNFQFAQTGADSFAVNREAETFGQLVRQIDIDPLILANFLVEHRARLDGAVRGPGNYLIGPSVTLNDLVSAAGGTVGWADQKGVELITTVLDREAGRGSTVLQTLPLSTATLSTYVVRTGDQLRFSQVSNVGSTGSITVQGEVRNPGTFSVLRGDKLSDVLARAGGLTEVAYPAATVFLRRSAAEQERASYQRAASEVQEQLVVAMTRVGNSRIEPSSFASLQTFVTELRQQRALGRISIIADPAILASRPELDPLLEPGDMIYVPQRPSTISVLGQVLQPGNYPYIAGESVGDYIQRAGGYARTADESQTYVVFPDGSARRWERSWFQFDMPSLPPGTSIVIPRDVSPLDLRQTIIDVTQILSQLAVSIASVAVISNQ